MITAAVTREPEREKSFEKKVESGKRLHKFENLSELKPTPGHSHNYRLSDFVYAIFSFAYPLPNYLSIFC